MAIWCVCFCGMPWRAIGRLSGIPFGTLFSLFARWTRLGLWRRLLDRLRRTWRIACGDTPEPSTVVIDSPLSPFACERLPGKRSCRSAPSGFERGVEGGKTIRGSIVEAARSMIHLGVEKYGIPRAIDISPANLHDTKGIIPVLRDLAGRGFQGPALGDLGYRGQRLAKIGETLGITVEPIARGRAEKFLPAGSCWVVERSFSWLARYRRLNTIFDRTKEHLIAFVQIAFVSILSRPLKRLVTEKVCA
jgi:transposase